MNKKKITFYLIIGILSMTVIWGAGILNLWKDLVEGQNQWLNISGRYVESYLSMADHLADKITAEDLLDIIELLAEDDTLFYNKVDYYYVFDNETGEMAGEGDTDRAKALFRLSARTVQLTKGWQYLTIPFGDRQSVILEVSTESLEEELIRVIPDRLRSLGAAAAVYLLLLWILTHVFQDEQKRDWVVSVILFGILSVLIAFDAFTAIQNQKDYLTETEEIIYDAVESDIRKIGSSTAEKVEQYTGMADTQAGRLELVEQALDDYSFLTESASYDSDTVFDDNLPVRDRVQIIMNTDQLRNSILEYLLETIMYAVLAVILFRGIIYYRDDFPFFRNREENGSVLRSTVDWLKIIVTVKSFADALTVIVTVKLLKSFLTADLGSAGSDTALTCAIMMASGAAIAATLLIPRLIRLAGGSGKLLPFTLAVCSAGSLLCFLADGSLMFVIGYLMIASGDAVFGLMYLMVSYEQVPADQNYLKETSIISRGRYGGQIIGYVVGGTLVTIVPYHFMYLAAFFLLAFLILPAVRIAGSEKKNRMPEHSFFLQTLMNKRFLLFLLLIQIPYSMVYYYFKYVVPLHVEAMNLTAALVSFLFFFRMIMKLVFRQIQKLRTFWKKFSKKTAALLCMLLTAGIFLMMGAIESIETMIILILLLALVEAKYSGAVVSLGYEILGNGMQHFFGYSALGIVSLRVGSTIAATLTDGISPAAIPFWMAGSAVLYLLMTFRSR